MIRSLLFFYILFKCGTWHTVTKPTKLTNVKHSIWFSNFFCRLGFLTFLPKHYVVILVSSSVSCFHSGLIIFVMCHLLSQHQPRSPFITHHHEMTLLERKHRPLCLVEEFPNDEDVLELHPAIKPRPRWDNHYLACSISMTNHADKAASRRCHIIHRLIV